MKRTPLPPRKKYLPRSRRPIGRTRRPKARKQDPAKRRFAKRRCKPFTEWLKTQACSVTGKRTGEWIYEWVGDHHEPADMILVDPAHTRPRSLGADDLYQCLPLARHLHEEQERIGWPRFERKYGFDRHEVAREHTERWLETEAGQAWRAAHPESVG